MARRERERPIRDAATQAEETLFELENAVLEFRDWMSAIRANGIQYEIAAEFAGHQAPVKIKGTLWPGGRPAAPQPPKEQA